jgi:hypothetical protein
LILHCLIIGFHYFIRFAFARGYPVSRPSCIYNMLANPNELEFDFFSLYLLLLHFLISFIKLVKLIKPQLSQ